jgi:hypothetical protein
MRVANADGERFDGRTFLCEHLGRVSTGSKVLHAGLHNRALVVVDLLQAWIDGSGFGGH